MEEPFKTHGVFSWNELMTTDVAAAKNFYTELFGWTTEEMSVTPGMTYTVVKRRATASEESCHVPRERKACRRTG